MTDDAPIERLAIAGSGAIACGLANHAAAFGPVLLWARSESSATRARGRVEDGVEVVTDLARLAEASFVVESVIEDFDRKADLLRRLDAVVDPGAVLASSTSSLSVAGLADVSGRRERFVGFHPFNPVKRMELVELVFPAAALPETRERARALCVALEKTAIEVPDLPGFVVNRLLFPFLFRAVLLLDEGGMEPRALDACMKLGAAHPMGPLALLDLVGIDVAVAIGDSLGEEVPERLRQMAAEGRTGRKARAGFYTYEERPARSGSAP